MIRRERLSHPTWAVTLVLVACLAACGGGSAPHPPPNVVLIVLDTARGDHFSLLGHRRETSPRLDAFAAHAITFERAYSTSCWTVPSHGSLFTGLLPVTHGATQEHLRLDASLQTLAELLAERGYTSAAFSNNSWVSKLTGLTRGFDEVHDMWRGPARAEGAPHPTNLAVRDWLRRRDPSRPFFLFVNYIEVHWPYDAFAAYQDRFIPRQVGQKARERADFSAVQWYLSGRRRPRKMLALRERLYDAGIAQADAAAGDLLDEIRDEGLLDDSLVIITADHGENLGEHGHQGHSFALYESTLHVPLVIRPPGGASGERRRDPVQLTDVFATIAKAAGAKPADPRVVGRDLLAGPLPDDRPLVAEYYRPDMFLRRFPDTERARRAVAPFRRRLRAIRVGDQKLIQGSDGSRELYDLASDPAEAHDLAKLRPEQAAALEARLDALVKPLAREVEPVRPETLDPETEASLRALGYL